jgi:hypothetical protein
VQEGQELRPDQAAQKPTVCWDGDENDFHTLGTPVSCSHSALAGLALSVCVCVCVCVCSYGGP